VQRYSRSWPTVRSSLTSTRTRCAPDAGQTVYGKPLRPWHWRSSWAHTRVCVAVRSNILLYFLQHLRQKLPLGVLLEYQLNLLACLYMQGTRHRSPCRTRPGMYGAPPLTHPQRPHPHPRPSTAHQHCRQRRLMLMERRPRKQHRSHMVCGPHTPRGASRAQRRPPGPCGACSCRPPPLAD
jgi:hypothetical protein